MSNKHERLIRSLARYRCRVCRNEGLRHDGITHCHECGCPLDGPVPPPFMTPTDRLAIALKEAHPDE